VIGKVCKRGSDVRRLLGYLFREGLAGEHGLSAPHTDAHLIAAWDGIDGLEPPRQADGDRDLGLLAAALNAPLLAASLGKQEWAQARPVYHLAISAAETDRTLTDDEWADVVGEYVHRIGLAPRGDEEAVRWVAVRHADNHVHVVATLARQDGKRVWPRNDFYRAREASLAVEDRYGLTRTSPADRTGDRQTSRAEQRRHALQVEQRAATGRPVPAGPDREMLRSRVRAALAGANSFEEFSERLSRDGVLVRPRMSTLNPDEVTGYAVALCARGAEAAQGAEPVWFGGGKLAPDLTLPQLKARWCREGTDARQAATTARARTAGLELDPSERQALWEAAGQAIGRAEEQLQAAASGDPTARAMAEAAAVASSEVLAAVGRLTERSGAGPLHRAAEVYDRAARVLRRRPPIPTGPARRTRRAAGGLRGMGFVRTADTRQLLQTLDQLSRLSHTLAGLREQQGRTAQATAARQAAELLTAEQTRRSHAAYAGVRGLTATPEMTRTTGSLPAQGPFPPPFGWPGRPAEPTPASRPGGPGEQAQWRADPCRRGSRPLPVGDEGLPARVMALAGGEPVAFGGGLGTPGRSGSESRKSMIVCHRPPCDRTYHQ